MSKSFYSVLSSRGSEKSSSHVIDGNHRDQYEFQSVLPASDTDQTLNCSNGDSMRVFWLRTLTCILVPVFVTGYYAGLWAYWIQGYDDDGPVPVGPPAGRWAYYIW
jgi:hypothetical protein